MISQERIRVLVEGLAEQQAMPDDWWKSELESILAASAPANCCLGCTDECKVYGSQHPIAASAPALQAGQGEPKDWAKIEAFIDEYVSDYEMLGEAEDGRDACYTPNDNDRALLRDCIAGLLAEDEFLAMLAPTHERAAPAPEPQAEWVSVPAEPTAEMCIAAVRKLMEDRGGAVAWEDVMALCYRSMLSASPSQPVAAEGVAKAIYEQWAGKPGFVPWVNRGNSLMQDKARDIARAALAITSESATEVKAQELPTITDVLDWAASLATYEDPGTSDWYYDDRHDLAKTIRKGPEDWHDMLHATTRAAVSLSDEKHAEIIELIEATYSGDGVGDIARDTIAEVIDAINLAASLAPAQQGCEHCGGTGEIFGHAEDCTDDLCALNGDTHSCGGRVEPCACTKAPSLDIPPGCEMARGWAVEVSAQGARVLLLSDVGYSGLADIEPWASTIRGCAEHLQAFIGPVDGSPALAPEPESLETSEADAMEPTRCAVTGCRYALDGQGLAAKCVPGCSVAKEGCKK